MKKIVLLLFTSLFSYNFALTQNNLDVVPGLDVSLTEYISYGKSPELYLNFETRYEIYPSTGFGIKTSTKIKLDTLMINLEGVLEPAGPVGEAVSKAYGNEVIPANIRFIQFINGTSIDTYSIVQEKHVAKMEVLNTQFTLLKNSCIYRHVNNTCSFNGDSTFIFNFLDSLPKSIKLVPYSYPSNVILPADYKRGRIYRYGSEKDYKELLALMKEKKGTYFEKHKQFNAVFWNYTGYSYYTKSPCDHALYPEFVKTNPNYLSENLNIIPNIDVSLCELPRLGKTPKMYLSFKSKGCYPHAGYRISTDVDVYDKTITIRLKSIIDSHRDYDMWSNARGDVELHENIKSIRITKNTETAYYKLELTKSSATLKLESSTFSTTTTPTISRYVKNTCSLLGDNVVIDSIINTLTQKLNINIEAYYYSSELPLPARYIGGRVFKYNSETDFKTLCDRVKDYNSYVNDPSKKIRLMTQYGTSSCGYF